MQTKIIPLPTFHKITQVYNIMHLFMDQRRRFLLNVNDLACVKAEI